MKHLLKYYEALQPSFRERMGSWHIGDTGFYYESNLFVIYVGMECPTIEYVLYYKFLTANGTGIVTSDPKDIFWLPRAIDDSSPEAYRRSLWGMVDWSVTVEDIDSDGMINIFVEDVSVSDGWQVPTLALLKALCAQNGIKVKE